MEFEYDPNKSISNKQKHGIDFEEALRIWDDPDYIILPSYSKGNEARFIAIGMIDSKHWSVIFTFRNSTVRIISVRRSRKVEVKHYEED